MTYHSEPTRKPDCRHYPACLADAAYSNADLNCDACAQYESEILIPDQQELAGCRALAAAVLTGTDTPLDDLLGYYLDQTDCMTVLDLPVVLEARQAVDTA